MANKLTKTDNRGVFMKAQFSGGGVAPSDAALSELFDTEVKPHKLTRKELSNRIIHYFRSCFDEVVDETTGQTERVWKIPPTKSGFCLAVGISQKTLSNYLKDERTDRKPFNNSWDEHTNRIISTDDFDLLHTAVSVIENYYESKLAENRNVAGVIFWLNNINNPAWSNQQAFSFDVKPYGVREDDNSSDSLPDLWELKRRKSETLPDIASDEGTTE